MKYLLLVLFCFSMNSFAIDEDCKQRVQNAMTTDSEKYLFQKYPELLDQFVTDCRKTEFGDMATLGSVVFVHEAAHFEDLGWNDPSRKGEFNLYMVNDEHIGALNNTNNLPKIKNVVRPILKEKFSELISDSESKFMGMHEGYDGAEDSIAAETLTGMATELSAYTHGLRVESQIKKQVPATAMLTSEEGVKFEYPNPLKEIRQIEGVYYFIFAFNLYLDDLKNNYPNEWKEFNNNNNQLFLKKLFQQVVQTLKEVKHCELAKNEERSKYWQNLIRENDMLPALSSILGEDAIMELQCTKPTQSVIDFENINTNTEPLKKSCD